MKRLLLDQGLAPRAALILRKYGFDASHVAEVGLDHADDILIFARARDGDIEHIRVRRLPLR